MLAELVVREYAAQKVLAFVIVVGAGCVVYLWWLWFTLWGCSGCGRCPRECRCQRRPLL